MLNLILKRAGVITGPRRKHTSHSSLEGIKRDLLGLPQFKGNEKFLWFGSALHEVFLEGDYTNAYKKLGKEDRKLIDAMVKKLNSNAIVVSLMRDSIREHKFHVFLNKVKTVVILDSKQPKLLRGFDLKSTNATSQKDFEEKVKSMGYVRQGLTYKLAAKLKHFYFVGITKTAPHHIYIVDIGAPQFKTDYKYAEAELKFLLYFYKNYGKTIIVRKHSDETNSNNLQFIRKVSARSSRKKT